MQKRGRHRLCCHGFWNKSVPLRAAISPERDKSWSLEQRSPLTPIQSLAPVKQHHIPWALSPSAAVSFSSLLRGQKQLRINLNHSLNTLENQPHLTSVLLHMKTNKMVAGFIFVPEHITHRFQKGKLTFCRLVGFNWVLSMIFIATWKRHQGILDE